MKRMPLCLIPHAGEVFAGPLRTNVFRAVKASNARPRRIVYVAANHATPDPHNYGVIALEGSAPTWAQRVPTTEHSFDWVRGEIARAFPSVAITAIMLTRAWTSKEKLVLEYLAKAHTRGDLVIATSDLMHYGKKYDWTSLRAPQQEQKQLLEGPLINAIVASDPNRVTSILEKEPRLACGPWVLACVATLAQRLRLHGRVIDYYDSHAQETARNTFERYAVSARAPTFVSYVGILYSTARPQRRIGWIDQMLGLAAVRNAIAFPSRRIDPPLWTVWHQLTQGVFTGVEDARGKIKCCQGSYEAKGRSTAYHIIEATRNCASDSRWVSGDLGNYKYKIDLLQLRSKWKKNDSD